MEEKKMVRKIEQEYDPEEDTSVKKEQTSQFQIVTENQLLNAKLDHIITLLEKKSKD